jgi:hypothetical protein
MTWLRAESGGASRRGLTSSTGGEGGIRTPDAGITDITVFETAAFNRSATSPRASLSTRTGPFNHPRHRSPTTTRTLNLLVQVMVTIRRTPARYSSLDLPRTPSQTKMLQNIVFCLVYRRVSGRPERPLGAVSVIVRFRVMSVCSVAGSDGAVIPASRRGRYMARSGIPMGRVARRECWR